MECADNVSKFDEPRRPLQFSIHVQRHALRYPTDHHRPDRVPFLNSRSVGEIGPSRFPERGQNEIRVRQRWRSVSSSWQEKTCPRIQQPKVVGHTCGFDRCGGDGSAVVPIRHLAGGILMTPVVVRLKFCIARVGRVWCFG